ncbi:hypothetical protein G6F24_018348 [Rhizopus arrhizus]|nr:hypothetical protein G6F24_018348 [Rhizopus arrhizus]
MWQQDWSNLWDQLEPYPGAGSLDITAALEKQYQSNLSAALAKAGKDANADDRARAGLLRVAGHARAAAVVLGKDPVHQAR